MTTQPCILSESQAARIVPFLDDCEGVLAQWRRISLDRLNIISTAFKKSGQVFKRLFKVLRGEICQMKVANILLHIRVDEARQPGKVARVGEGKP